MEVSFWFYPLKLLTCEHWQKDATRVEKVPGWDPVWLFIHLSNLGPHIQISDPGLHFRMTENKSRKGKKKSTVDHWIYPYINSGEAEIEGKWVIQWADAIIRAVIKLHYRFLLKGHTLEVICWEALIFFFLRNGWRKTSSKSRPPFTFSGSMRLRQDMLMQAPRQNWS